MTRDQSEDGIAATLTTYATIERPVAYGSFERRRVLYVAHCLRPTQDEIAERFGAPLESISEDKRKFALEITRLDGVVLCGPRISAGMRAEVAAQCTVETRPEFMPLHGVYDITSLGSTPPTTEFKQPANFDEWARNISMLSELAK